MSGRVFKRGKTWSYVVDVGRGRHDRRQQMRGGFATKRAAQQALRDIARSIDEGTFVAPSQETISTFLVHHWLPAMRPPTLRGTTWVEYRRKVNVHVVPRLGNLPLQSLTAGHLNGFYADLLASGRADGTGGLAPKIVRKVHVILRKALQDAVRWGHVNRNVAQFANPPSQRATAAARRRHMQTWTPAELATFLEHSDDLTYAWILTTTTGMRRGEVLGLRWSVVDLDANRLAVRQTLASVDGQPELSEPKTNRSGRVIDLDERTVRRCARGGHDRLTTGATSAPRGTTSIWSSPARTACGCTPTGSASCSAGGSPNSDCHRSACTTCATRTPRCSCKPA